jgi:hypothetical protein
MSLSYTSIAQFQNVAKEWEVFASEEIAIAAIGAFQIGDFYVPPSTPPSAHVLFLLGEFRKEEPDPRYQIRLVDGFKCERVAFLNDASTLPSRITRAQLGSGIVNLIKEYINRRSITQDQHLATPGPGRPPSTKSSIIFIGINHKGQACVVADISLCSRSMSINYP